nr:MAG TPA: hypothetical protein [Caudoviricetes sp.]
MLKRKQKADFLSKRFVLFAFLYYLCTRDSVKAIKQH